MRSKCAIRVLVVVRGFGWFWTSMCTRNLVLLAFLLHLVVVSSHEVVRVDSGPPGLVYAVQVSDIHISKWKPERGRALRRALGHALKLIKPAIVLISGDLVGAYK